ncbi:hypothetical protein Q361_11726 [Flavobacterium croceum DSM 17960]|uniref:Uncharacterized protein n=1 Tax=Flavobacterium croceum DSM 17960 TaxID=1121886 RepID=A0A2S4N6H5_9FLAO|nr:hypothetical protein [Flavobacterium croceum]POS00923.1 hypothetical protein Q361_11726 [Flavobacterium croceum DSM 17960]
MNTKVKSYELVEIDTIGFAQVGQEDYAERIIIEKKILLNFLLDNPLYAVPEFFTRDAFFHWQLRNHDFGTYHVLCIVYDKDLIQTLCKEAPDQFHIFWDWTDRCQSAFDKHYDELLQQCNNAFYD